MRHAVTILLSHLWFDHNLVDRITGGEEGALLREKQTNNPQHFEYMKIILSDTKGPSI